MTLSFAGGQDIADTADTALANTTPTGTNENTYDVDNTAPTVGITGVPATSSAPFTATFTFSEAVTGFVVGDIEVGNGAASDFMETSTSVYTALITPASDGLVTVDVAKDVAMDPAGNDNAAATQATSEYTTPDTTAPQVTSIERQTPTTSPTNADSLTWRITFNEDVQHVDAADFTVSGTTATLAVREETASTVYDVTASGGDLASLDATVTLSFAGGQNITDTADTALANTTPTGTNENTYDVDNTAPTVGITGVPATSSAPFTATFTFSEAVTGFVVGDIEVGNGAASDFMETSTSVYTALITPASDGEVTVDVAKDVAMDPAGNDNAAATQAMSEYTTPDTTAPQVTSIERQTPTTSPTNADSLTWRITFNEDVQHVDAADFTVSGTTATPVVNVVTASTVYDVTASGGDLASLDATVTLSFAGGQNITDTADTALANTTPTGTNENTYDVDNTAPTVGITGVPATSSAPFTATFTFSEAVTGFVVGDIEVGNGAASDFMETSTSVYTALITPASDGLVTVDVAKDVAMDPAGNDNTAATQATSEYTTPDTTAPQVTSIERQTPTTSPTNADSLTWRITFNEDVQNVDAADFTVSGTTATLAVREETASTGYDVTASGGDLASLDATVTLSFAGGQNITDTADTALANTTPTGTNENTYDVDNTAPTVGITGVPATSSAPFTATFTFSEAVTGFVVGDIEVGNGAASDFMETSTSVYTALITPASDGLVTVDVAKDVAMDPAGNDNAAATQAMSEYTTPDTTAPQVTSIERQTPTTSPTNADSLTWRITFNEDVQNVDAADFTVSGTTATLVVNVVTASTVYDVTASGGDLASLDATVTLSFAGGQNITDTADTALANTTPTGTNENTYDVDNTAPTVGITGVPATSSAPFTATFTFSEAVTGFVVGDIEVGNGAASDFMETSTSVYTALITPASDGLVTVDVAKDVAMDPAGNDNAAATQATSEYTTPDTTAPQVTSIERQTPTTSPTNADSLTWRITFNEDVQNVDAADFTVSGTTATPVVNVVTASTVYDVTASGGDLASLDATVTLSFAGGQNITDTADTALANTTPTGTNENTYDVDNTAPTVGITGVPATSSAPFTATFTFSEAVTGFVVGDIEVGNGAASDFMETSTSVYTALITPASDGLVTVDVAKDVAMDPAGNDNAAATQATSEYTTPDTTAPQVTSIERQTPTTSPTNADSLTWRITFNEDVQNVDAADFTVSGTTATLEAAAVPGSSSRYDVTASGGDLAGLNATVTLSFAGGQDITDTADTALANTTPTGTNENTYDVDNTAPTVGITGVPATSSAPFTATFTFSEAVTGFVVGDIEVGNGAASDFMETSTSVYTALITPASDGEVTVDVAKDVAMDPAGNDNAAATQATSEYTTPDTTAPQVTSIERQTPTTSPTNADSLTWRITFNEDVQNVDAADFTVSGTTATPVVNVVTASTVYDVTASGGDLASLDATVTLSFAGGQNITDTADTALANTTPTGTNENTYDVDNTAPTVGITGVPATSSAPFTATFTFSEAVTGFVVGDIEVGNGAASDFMETSTSVYTALITPASDGLVTVDVAKDVAMDPAGNDNAAATQATSEYTTPDTTAPQVTSIERQTPTTSPTNADSLTWRITFNEDVQNVDAADFTVSGTTATGGRCGERGSSSTVYDVTASAGAISRAWTPR